MPIKIDNWIPYYKYDEQGKPGCMSQQTYEPLISPDGKTFCANYSYDNKYQRLWQPDRPLYTEEVVEYFFRKEVEYALKFQSKPWAPEIIEMDWTDKRIFYKWNGPTCNEMIYGNGIIPDDWKIQIHSIMTDLFREGVYKLTMYPHCHFFDTHGQMHCIDMYGCVDVNDPYIDKFIMDGIIHDTARFRLEETGELIDNRYNLEKMFIKSLNTHVKWGDDTLEHVYQSIFGEHDVISG